VKPKPSDADVPMRLNFDTRGMLRRVVGQAELQSVDFSEPGFPSGFVDAGSEVVPDVDQSVLLGWAGSRQSAVTRTVSSAEWSRLHVRIRRLARCSMCKPEPRPGALGVMPPPRPRTRVHVCRRVRFRHYLLVSTPQ